MVDGVKYVLKSTMQQDPATFELIMIFHVQVVLGGTYKRMATKTTVSPNEYVTGEAIARRNMMTTSLVMEIKDFNNKMVDDVIYIVYNSVKRCKQQPVIGRIK